MKRQLRERLRVETNAQLAQSIVFPHDRSFIHELGDLIQEEVQLPIAKNHAKIQKITNSFRTQMKSVNSFSQFRNLKGKTDTLKVDNKCSNLLRQRSKNKINNEQYNDGFFVKTHHKPSHYPELQYQQKRNSLKDPPIFQSKKQIENNSLRIKFDFNRSNVIKNKQFIYNNLLKRCEHCNCIKSQVFRNNFVCSSKNCRLMHFFQDFQTFPLSSILYQVETPSSNCQQLQQLIKKINDEIQKIENWRNSLIELQFQIQNMIQTRRQFQKHNKNELRNLISSITQIKSKRTKPTETEIQETVKKLQNLQLRKVFQEFNRWKRVNQDKFSQSKVITELIHKYKPLSLKVVNSQIAGQIASITDNFNSTQVIIRTTQFLSYNFNGRLNKITILIDGSIQLKRDNFLLIENLEYLKIVFQSRKTSRELRQLFNILPNVCYISLDFDYKLHSHVSSQTFPIITKVCEIASKCLQVNLLNARPQVFQDMIEASKIIKAKQKLKIYINMNPFITQSQWPQYSKSIDWGTKLLKNLLKNVGSQIIQIDLNIPILVNLEQISEFLINSDSLQLIKLNLNTLNNEIESKQKNIKQLLHQIINKRLIRKDSHHIHQINVTDWLNLSIKYFFEK